MPAIFKALEELERAWRTHHSDHADTAHDVPHSDSGTLSVFGALLACDPTQLFPSAMLSGKYAQSIGSDLNQIVGSSRKEIVGQDMKVLTDPASFLASIPLLSNLLGYLPLVGLGLPPSWGDSKWVWGASTSVQFGQSNTVRRGGDTKHIRTPWVFEKPSEKPTESKNRFVNFAPQWPLPSHVDTEKGEYTPTHTDSPHKDVAHSDTAHLDVVHADAVERTFAHFDHSDGWARPPHVDHADRTNPVHNDVMHVDAVHQDARHADAPAVKSSTEPSPLLGGIVFATATGAAAGMLSMAHDQFSLAARGIQAEYDLRKEIAAAVSNPFSITDAATRALRAAGVAALQVIDGAFMIASCLLGGFILLSQWAIAAIMAVNYKGYKTSGYDGPKQVPFYLTQVLQNELLSSCLSLVAMIENLSSLLSEAAHGLVDAGKKKKEIADAALQPATAAKKVQLLADLVAAAKLVLGLIATALQVIDTLRGAVGNLGEIWDQMNRDKSHSVPTRPS